MTKMKINDESPSAVAGGGCSGERAGIITRDFVILTCVNFFSSLMFYFLIVVMSGYAISAYGVGIDASSLAITLYIAGALFGRVILGGEIDRLGVSAAIKLGYLLNILVCLLYFSSLPWGSFLLVRFAHGITFALQSGAGSAGAAILLPEQRRAEGLGYFTISQSAGTAIGPFLAAVFLRLSDGYGLMFRFLAIAGIVAFLGSCFVRVPAINRRGNVKRRLSVYALFCKPAIPASFVMFVLYLCYGSVMSFVLIFAADAGIGGAARYYFLAYAIATIVCRLFSGRIVDENGPSAIVYPAIAIMASAFFVLSVSKEPLGFIASAVLLGAGLGSTQSTLLSVVASAASMAELGKANSTFLTALDLGSSVGPVLFGLLVDSLGFRVAYGLFGLVVLFSISIYKWSCGKG